MPTFVHLFDTVIYRLQPAFILAAVITWAVALVGHFSGSQTGRRLSPKFLAAGLIFVSIIGGEFAVVAFIKRAALDEIRPKLFANIENVAVNGNEMNNSVALIDALRNMHDVRGHHSSPTTYYRISLKTSRGTLVLCLGRDSQDKHEYWVYYPEFYSANSNAVGHVFSDALNEM